MTVTKPTEENEHVRRLFDTDGKCRGYSSTPDPVNVSEKEMLEWSISLLEGETGMATEYTLNGDGTVTLSSPDWLTDPVTTPVALAAPTIMGVLGGFNAALNGRGKARERIHAATIGFAFPSLFGGGIF